MTTITYDSGTLYSDSLNIKDVGEGIVTIHNKIETNDSNTIAWAHTGNTVEGILKPRFMSIIEYNVVFTLILNDPKIHYKFDILKSYYKQHLIDIKTRNQTLIISNCIALYMPEDSNNTLDIIHDEFMTIGCYVRPYHLYRRMGFTPEQAYEKIFNYAEYSRGPLHGVKQTDLLMPDVDDYLLQIKNNKMPVLNAIKK